MKHQLLTTCPNCESKTILVIETSPGGREVRLAVRQVQRLSNQPVGIGNGHAGR